MNNEFEATAKCFRLSLLSVVAAWNLSHATPARSSEINERQARITQRQSMDERDPAQLGKMLRTDLDRAYRALVDTGKLRNQGTGRNYVSDVFLAYIPVGSSFERAEEILRAA